MTIILAMFWKLRGWIIKETLYAVQDETALIICLKWVELNCDYGIFLLEQQGAARALSTKGRQKAAKQSPPR